LQNLTRESRSTSIVSFAVDTSAVFLEFRASFGVLYAVSYVMAANPVRVSAKPVIKRPGTENRGFVFAGVLVLLASVASVFGYDYFSGRLGLIGPQFEITETAGRKVIKVPAGGNLQGALEAATSGDIVELQAGATYSGQINLPNKPHTDFVTIRSSATANLPEGKRVSPQQKLHMATITSGMLGRGAVSAANGAHHYRFVGIEFTASGSMYNYGVVVLGSGETRPDRVPHAIEIDRSFIHPSGSTRSRRGIALNSADTVIKNSYISGFGFPTDETQGICGWTGTRNVKILNNYVEGGAENIMFGGADPANAELIPSDIEVRGNHLNKPKEWFETATVKTLFEIKNAKRVAFTANYLENNWKGSAFRITVRNQDGGAPFSTIENVTIRENVINGSGDGINILGRDDTQASQTLRGLTIENNLFLGILGDRPGFEGSGYFIQVADGENITIANNTVFNSGNIVTFYGTLPRGFVFRNNITGHGAYGIHGPIDLKSEIARSMFVDNVFMNLNRVPQDDYAVPPGNTILRDEREVGFVNASADDYRLAGDSKYRGKGANIVGTLGVRSE
jgi:hypothetical protein